MLSVATVMAQARILLNEASAAYWPDADFTSWCTLAAGDISSKTLCYEQIGSITIVAGTSQYPYSGFSPNCLKVIGVTFDGVGLKKAKVQSSGLQIATVTSGTPEYFWDFASYLGLFPTPVAADVGKVTKVFYADWTNSITLIPDKFLTAAAFFCCTMAFIKERQFQRAAAMQQMYLQLVGMERSDITQEKQEAKPQTDYIVPISR